MKKTVILFFLLIIAFCKNENVYDQSDSLKVEYKQESIDSSDFAVRRKYKYLDIILKDEKNLIKVGIQPSILYTEMKFKIVPHLIFEKKISPEWSIIIEDVIEFSTDNNVIGRSASFNTDLVKSKVFKNTINFGTRYYYGMKKAIQKKISGNNFNSNYFELNISGLPSISRYRDTYKKQIDMFNYEFITENGTYISYSPSAQVSWGLQRRLNNYSFIDAKMLVGFSTEWDPNVGADPWYVGINIIFGFGYNVKHK
mgnify:CR=1 FL=1